MTNKEKIIVLKQYKNYLLLLKKYQNQVELEKAEQEQQVLDKPKVLVLKKQFYGRNIVVS